MDRAALRAFAQRDWAAVARAKREHQARIFRDEGVARLVELSRGLHAHARAVNPQWPSAKERDADLAHHVALKQLLSRASRDQPVR